MAGGTWDPDGIQIRTALDQSLLLQSQRGLTGRRAALGVDDGRCSSVRSSNDQDSEFLGRGIVSQGPICKGSLPFDHRVGGVCKRREGATVFRRKSESGGAVVARCDDFLVEEIWDVREMADAEGNTPSIPVREETGRVKLCEVDPPFAIFE